MKRVNEYLDMLLEAKDDGQKKYHVFPHQVGKTRNIVDFHDGVKKHKDGSEFWDMRSFSRKKDMESFVKELIAQGYRESKGPLYESSAVTEGRAAEGLILHSDDGRFKYSVSKNRETGEWVAKAYLDGKYDEGKTIYETDKEAALASAKADMVRWNKLNSGTKTEAAERLHVVHGEFEGVKPGSLSKAMSKEQAQAFFDDLAGRPHLNIKNMKVIPASKSDPVWKNEAGDDRFDRASEYLIRRGRAVKEADESSGPEPKVITQLRKIVDEMQADKVTDPKTGKKKMVDGTTANFIVRVWDQMPMKYREGFESRIIPMGIHAMASFAFKVTGK